MMFLHIIIGFLFINVSLGRTTTTTQPKVQDDKLDKVKSIEKALNEDEEDSDSDSDVNIYDYGIGQPILDVVKLDDVIESRNKIKAQQKTEAKDREVRKSAEEGTTENPETSLEEEVKAKEKVIKRLKHQIQTRDKKLIHLRESLQNIVDDLNIEL